ncbi:MAG: hypothetical protein IH595_07360 [Bacteroidales bacterium]|nr:hypothetical protein [Bacteroidales bacterium]
MVNEELRKKIEEQKRIEEKERRRQEEIRRKIHEREEKWKQKGDDNQYGRPTDERPGKDD